MKLPITGERLTMLSPGPYVIVLGAGVFEIHIEGELVVHRAIGSPSHRLAGEPRPEDLSAAVDGVIVSATVESTGELRIDLDSGHRIVVEPDQYFEAWHVTDPGRYLVACMPGGELAVWSQDA
ncbi:DUF6188 family protein [Nocardia acidivorans]|uniref:DUF6188 family protein n=1 Tax=Nocardia acidivorans TaxID=404580 RepID=UPI00082FC914|nr:DUF6188 family protein [Nocardia acidivorans]